MGRLSPGKRTRDILKIAVIRVDPFKKISEDVIGNWIRKQAKKYSYEVVIHQVVTNEIISIQEMVSHIAERIVPQGIIVSGGTGISVSDVAIEALQPLFVKELSFFGPIFANLVFEKKDSSVVMDRAMAGIIHKSIVFCIPDEMDVCKLICNELIFPELGNISKKMEE